MKRIYLLAFILMLVQVVTNGYWINDLDHPCLRECKAGREPMTCEYHWTIESYYSMSRACYQCPFVEDDCHRPHCVPMAGYPRPVYSVNRRLPGPSIQVCENDIIKVHARNRMKNGETEAIHWHGLHMRGTQHMDGVPHVTQCPISVDHDMTYEFAATDPGTHWWHSHTGSHRGDGVFGSFIVRQSSEDDPHRKLYDKDEPHHVIIINEWGKATTNDIDLANHHGASVLQNDGILINGRGTNQILTRPDNTTATVDHHIVYVRSGFRYRFRVIGAASGVCTLTISVDDHELTVIAMDGAPINPVTVDRISVFSGERYDFVLTADQPPTNYWIRVAGHQDCEQFQEVSILRYAGTPSGTKPEADKSTRAQGKVLNSIDGIRAPDSILVSDLTDAEEKRDDLSHVDVTHYLELNDVLRNGVKELHDPVFYPYERAGDETFLSTTVSVINNISFSLPTLPPLTHWNQLDRASWCNMDSLRTSGKNCSHEACECVHGIDIKFNQVVELVYVNTLDVMAMHPMHLHGYYVEIVGMETMWKHFTIEDFKRLDAEGLIKRNLKNPPRKDTFMVPKGGYAIVRFRADNPGWWLMHCHFEDHFKLGMGIIFHVEGDVPPPPTNMPVCPRN